MNPKLLNKVNARIREEAEFGNWGRKTIRKIKSEVKNDLILPCLNLRSNARVNFGYPDDTTIELTIGPRDFTFDRETGECVGTGILLF